MTIESTSIALPAPSLQVGLDRVQLLRRVDPDRFFRMLAREGDHLAALCDPGDERQEVALAGAGTRDHFTCEPRKQVETGLRREREESHVALTGLGHGVALPAMQHPGDPSGRVALEV